MRVTGKRHPFLAKYRAAFDEDGTILAVEINLFSDGGCSTDLSLAVLERAMLHADNAYFIPSFRVTGRVCRTNLPSNTAFRGFGGPQGMTAIENVIEEIARAVGRDALDVRVRNCYTSAGGREVTPYGQALANNTLPELFARLRVESNYDLRRREIEKFNRKSRTHLRGLALTPVKFGISFTRRTLNQANALVNVYTDGSVLVSTGATEMGQGVNTRIRQLVADELGVEYDNVLIGPTSTDKNNNTSPTAASSGTDLNGAAAIDACGRIRSRLAEFLAWKVFRDVDAGLAAEASQVRFERGEIFDVRRPQKRITFQQACCMAYEHRISLGERGFYVTPGVDFNRETGRGTPFLYFTNGVACSEVLIDRFTGETSLPRVDLLMDIGQSINPGIDRGQITGAFIQGVGWVTTEELRYNAQGHLLSHSPTTYKIPNVSDTPLVFNVSTLENPNNLVSLKRSKAVGEPPLMLAISAWAAVKDALRRAADIVGVASVPPLRLPATAECIALALEEIRTIVKPLNGADVGEEQILPDSPATSVVQ
jgi:xanthine dehydrogenase large subunit